MKPPRRKLFLAAAALLTLPLVGLSGLHLVGEEGPPLGGVFADGFELLERPLAPPNLAFAANDGRTRREVHLKDFAGKVVLLNFWATWCAPCVREMPSLAALDRALGPEGLAVVAVSTDRGGLSEVGPFYALHRLAPLKIYLDPDSALAEGLGIRGLPTSFLLDRKGQVVGRMEGPAPWDSPEALALLRYYLEKDSSLMKAGN